MNPLVTFYDIWKKERGAILLLCPGHHTRRHLVMTVKLRTHVCFCKYEILNNLLSLQDIFTPKTDCDMAIGLPPVTAALCW
jgi:hypothetical protein